MKKLLTITDGNRLMWVVLVDEGKVQHVEKLINNAYNEFYGLDIKETKKCGGYYNYITNALNKIDDVELLEFDILELDPHWR